ncbi:hypothetical protein FD37_GL001087 [Levilactobacillus spicheri DSM 15429]|uniref:Uncharacterized protein n=1 Tax=Levilactobacillus spicheri DSM 15429 TaxID=1423805 RepID=A0A0R1R691_9LACO|nr:hypothetical protein FD37_GL001087 [Levilactobacillus spicheri DSM 15429]
MYHIPQTIRRLIKMAEPLGWQDCQSIKVSVFHVKHADVVAHNRFWSVRTGV